MRRPIDRSRPRWWGAKLRLAEVRDGLRELAQDEDDAEGAERALTRLALTKAGSYDWLAIQAEVGEDDEGVLDALREVGSRIIEGNRGRGRPALSDAGGVTAQITVRLTEAHRAELDALVADGRGSSRVDAIRQLIEQSAARR